MSNHNLYFYREISKIIVIISKHAPYCVMVLNLMTGTSGSADPDQTAFQEQFHLHLLVLDKLIPYGLTCLFEF